MRLDCYRLHEHVPTMRAAKLPRDWMDSMHDRHAYRCLPLNMANVSGWEILCNQGFEMTWTGGNAAADITIVPDEKDKYIDHLVSSHFCYGIATFHTGHLFRTPPGWAVWTTGTPNKFKDGIQPLSGLVETDWLPYPFTMNWKFTRPGTVRFEKDEPFCYVTLMRPKVLESITPSMKLLSDNDELFEEYETWRKARSTFNNMIEAGNPDAIREAWQKFYMRGKTPDGKAAKNHTNRRRLAEPKKD
jgi:hypothetical protein